MKDSILRSQIDRALDELEGYEQGMRFQSLGVVLGKQRWPELVASEWRHDLGLDAYVTRSQATDGIGRGLACSITPAYNKISFDATKVVKNFGGQIQNLIFITSGKVSNEKKIEWDKRLRGEFGLELQVISREEIIASLTDPANVALCRTYLSISAEIDASLTNKIAKIREASRDEAKTWRSRLGDLPIIPLQGVTVSPSGADTEITWGLKELEEALRQARRVILEAPAGRGKTTTLIQLAAGELTEHGSAFLVDLQSWASSGLGILAFIAGMPSFEGRGITSQALAEAQSAERFYFLLNGWNEVTESLSDAAFIAIKDLERQFPSAGIAVATRVHYVAPPLPGAVRVRLRRVGRRARQEYIRARLGKNAPELLAAITTDPALDQLTRTPFVLAEVTSIVAAGEEIPRNRVAIMNSVISLHEKSVEHAQYLQTAPLYGMADNYLSALAAEMTKRGGVSLLAPEARSAASKVSSDLVVGGQTDKECVPGDILNALCAHHLLERVEYPVTSYRFEHQLYQEYYSSRALVEIFESAYDSQLGSAPRASFVEQFVNEPAWSEALDMLAEIVAERPRQPKNRKASQMTATLVQMALDVDPNFAAQLANTAGLSPTSPIAATLNQRLRDWYESKDQHHKNCALAGMLASGLSTFRDIVEPLLAAGDRQIRLRTNRLRSGLDISILGENWSEVVSKWDEDARADLVSEILYHRFDPGISKFALSDPSMKVRFAAMHGLNWIGADEEFVHGAELLTANQFARLLLELSPNSLPANVYPRARSDLTAYLASLTESPARLRLLLTLHGLSETSVVNQMKAELERIEVSAVESADQLLESVLETIRQTDSGWVSEWVAIRIARGELWRERWLGYVAQVPKEIAEEAFKQLSTSSVEHKFIEGMIALVGRGNNKELARRAFLRLVEVDRLIESSVDRQPMTEWEIHRQMEQLLRGFDANAVLGSISDLLLADSQIDIVARLSHLYGYAGRMGGAGEPLQLTESSRQLLRGYLVRSQEIMLREEDPDGSVKSAYASLLSQVGLPADIEVISTIIAADLQRLRAGREARRKGEPSAVASFAATTWTTWYIRSIVALLDERADKFLIQLLNEPEYEHAVIEQIGREFGLPPTSWGRSQSFETIWSARVTGPKSDPRRIEISNAIAMLMKKVDDSRSTERDAQSLNFRLKRLALGLSQTDPHTFKSQILTTLSLPGRYDAWITVDALHQLVFSGVQLSADECITLLDPSIDEMRKMGIRDQEQFLIKRYLALCVYVTPQSAGIDKIRQLAPIAHLSIYDFRDLLPALAHSRFDGAVGLMREMVQTPQNWQAIQYDWIEALTELETPNARQVALSFADPDLPGFSHKLDSGLFERVAGKIAKLASEDTKVDARIRELSGLSLDDQERELVALVLLATPTDETLLAALNLIDDSARPRTPWGLSKFLEQTFVERKPYEGDQGMFTLHAAAANDLREALYGMVFNDQRRKQTAYSLLGQIEEWRVEYGRPVDEPRHPAIHSGLPWPPPQPN